jgi:hypothetical protein
MLLVASHVIMLKWELKQCKLKIGMYSSVMLNQNLVNQDMTVHTVLHIYKYFILHDM